MAFKDRYYPYLVDLDLPGAWGFLGTLAGEDLAEARTWFQQRQTGVLLEASRELRLRADPVTAGGGVACVFALGPVRLLGPRTAARSIPWGHLWRPNSAGIDFLVARLCEADRDWAAEFVEAASGTRAGDHGWTLACVVRAVATHHDLPCPTGETFLKNWTAGVPQLAGVRPPDHDSATLAWLASDPFMPDLLFRYLSSGDCGRSEWLPAVVPELVAQGVVDRDGLVQHILTLLTAPQRPASQKVLVRILASVGLAADEVAGGAAFFLGVLATSTGIVVTHLLPLALDAVDCAEDLAELTAVIVSRSEKGPKNTLLLALGGTDLRSRVGAASIQDSLAVLAAGNDAAFTNKVRKCLAELAPEPAVPAQAPGAGWALWHQDPAPGMKVVEEPVWPTHRRVPTWSLAVDVTASLYDAPTDRQRLVDLILSEIATGDYDAGSHLDALRTVLSSGRLSMSATLGVFRDLFLSGGLRHGYGLAVGLADAAVRLSGPQPGTADLLRMLVEYAAEIPPDQRPAIPAGLVLVAQAPAASKTREEARALRRLLESGNGGAEPDRPQSPAASRWKAAILPGLGDYPVPTLDKSRVADLFGYRVPWDGMKEIAGVLTDESALPDRDAPGLNFCGPDLLVSDVLTLIGRSGVSAVATWLKNLEPIQTYGSWGGYLLALRSWATGTTIDGFWQAATARTAWSVVELNGGDYLGLDEDLRLVLSPQVTTWDAVAVRDTDPLGGVHGTVLARSLDRELDRLEYLRFLEALLLAERTTTMLARPVWADGTIDLDHLLARLRRIEGKPIGPLDLVQALHRLRPCGADRVAELTELRNSGGVWKTAPELTSPAGDDSWDVVDLVRHWVSEGGLPALDPVRAPGGSWESRAQVPVAWARCAAAPPEFRDGRWSLSGDWGTLSLARAFPLWPDRGVTGMPTMPSMLTGRFERPLHEIFLASLVGGVERRDVAALGAARIALLRGKVTAPYFVECVLASWHGGSLQVESLARAGEAMFEQDCLAHFWGPLLAAADALSQVSATPPKGLGRLVEVLARYAPEVPSPSPVPGLTSLAGNPSKAKPFQAARALVAAVSGRGEDAAP